MNKELLDGAAANQFSVREWYELGLREGKAAGYEEGYNDAMNERESAAFDDAANDAAYLEESFLDAIGELDYES